MAAGELSNANDKARSEARKTLIEQDYVDCVVQLSGQLFANTQVPCALWFLSKNRGGGDGSRKRHGQILFIDGRRLGALIPGSRKQKTLSSAEIESVAAPYRHFRRAGVPAEIQGFLRMATVETVRTQGYALGPGRYVGSADGGDLDELFEEQFPKLVQAVREQLKAASNSASTILTQLDRLSGDES
jgi:type I restriction enzyme M protein